MCTWKLRLEVRKKNIIFLKVPQPKFWCPGCAPAAKKFWRRHSQCNGTCFRESTSRTSQQYNFCCRALQSTKLTRLGFELLGGRFLLPWTVMHRKGGDLWTVKGFDILQFNCTCAKIFNCDEIQNAILTLDKVLSRRFSLSSPERYTSAHRQNVR